MTRSNRIAHPWLLMFVADLAALVAAYLTVLKLRFESGTGGALFDAVNQLLHVPRTGGVGAHLHLFYVENAVRLLILLAVTLGIIYAFVDLYPNRRYLLRRSQAARIILANAIALALFYGYWYLTRNSFHPRSVFGSLMALNVLYCLILRGGLRLLLRRLRGRGIDVSPAVLIGNHDGAQLIRELVRIRQPHGVRIAAEVTPGAHGRYGDLTARVQAAIEQSDARLVICADAELSVNQIMEVLALTEAADVEAKIWSDKLSVLTHVANIRTDIVLGAPVVHFAAKALTPAHAAAKRCVSTLLAAITLIVAAPLLLLVAGLIRLTSRGDALFRQERIGVNRKPFVMYKFRTMFTEAEQVQAELEEFNEADTGLFKLKADPRVTPVGRMLRRFSIDELPQLWNVVKGDMTLVGPRPLPKRDYDQYYEEWHYTRHGGLPGLTCIWQVSGRSHIGFHDMCILDVYYLRSQSWVLDAKIMLKTIIVVIFGRGAY